MGVFSRYHPSLTSTLEEDPSKPIDPYYLPNFRANDSLLLRDPGLSPTLQKRSFRPNYTSLPSICTVYPLFSRIANYPDSPLFAEDCTPLTPTLYPSSFTHPISPMYPRQPSGSEPSLFTEHMPFTTANSPPKRTTSVHQSGGGKSFHNSPQRPRRLSNTRVRGGSPGSPGSPDPSNELRIEDVISGKDKRTTLMIKNIPNAYQTRFNCDV